MQTEVESVPQVIKYANAEIYLDENECISTIKRGVTVYCPFPG